MEFATDKPAGMPAVVIREFCGTKLKAVKRHGGRFTAAQGIEAVSFFAGGKKDTSGKPGPRTEGARMRPKQRDFLYLYSGLRVFL
ncbi:MAG: hypothetical protein LBK05_07410 [Treponema sp.]|jgi:hypothetical protein|nr:hypothetical protein [Treponema sp.]